MSHQTTQQNESFHNSGIQVQKGETERRGDKDQLKGTQNCQNENYGKYQQKFNLIKEKDHKKIIFLRNENQNGEMSSNNRRNNLTIQTVKPEKTTGYLKHKLKLPDQDQKIINNQYVEEEVGRHLLQKRSGEQEYLRGNSDKQNSPRNSMRTYFDRDVTQRYNWIDKYRQKEDSEYMVHFYLKGIKLYEHSNKFLREIFQTLCKIGECQHLQIMNQDKQWTQCDVTIGFRYDSDAIDVLKKKQKIVIRDYQGREQVVKPYISRAFERSLDEDLKKNMYAYSSFQKKTDSEVDNLGESFTKQKKSNSIENCSENFIKNQNGDQNILPQCPEFGENQKNISEFNENVQNKYNTIEEGQQYQNIEGTVRNIIDVNVALSPDPKIYQGMEASIQQNIEYGETDQQQQLLQNNQFKSHPDRNIKNEKNPNLEKGIILQCQEQELKNNENKNQQNIQQVQQVQQNQLGINYGKEKMRQQDEKQIKKSGSENIRQEGIKIENKGIKNKSRSRSKSRGAKDRKNSQHKKSRTKSCSSNKDSKQKKIKNNGKKVKQSDSSSSSFFSDESNKNESKNNLFQNKEEATQVQMNIQFAQPNCQSSVQLQSLDSDQICNVLGLPIEYGENEIYSAIQLLNCQIKQQLYDKSPEEISSHLIDLPLSITFLRNEQIEYAQLTFPNGKSTENLIWNCLQVGHFQHPLLVLPEIPQKSIKELLYYHEVKVHVQKNFEAVHAGIVYQIFSNYGKIVDIFSLIAERAFVIIFQQQWTKVLPGPQVFELEINQNLCLLTTNFISDFVYPLARIGISDTVTYKFKYKPEIDFLSIQSQEY